jgi:hypothetical protein
LDRVASFSMPNHPDYTHSPVVKMSFFTADLYADLDDAVRGLRAAVRSYNALVRQRGWSDEMCQAADALRQEMVDLRSWIAELEEELGLDPGSVELPEGPDFKC